MVKEQEAQQAQTDAAIIKKVIQAYRAVLSENAANAKFDEVLALVDFQAQKIAEREKEIKRLKKIENAARDAAYYQGTRGSAQRLEEALEDTT